MIHAANTVIYNMVNDEESFNKEMASDSLEWNVMQSEVGTLSTAFFADMTCELSCPFSE